MKQTPSRKSFHQEALDIFNGADLVQPISGPTHKKGNTLRCSKQTLPGVSENDMFFD